MTTKHIKIHIETKKQFELCNITDQIKQAVSESQIHEGIVHIFSPHTTAAIRINHNEPLLIQDIMKMLYRTAPVDINYSHDLFELRQNIAPNERSNGHAHVKTFLLGNSQSIPISKGQIELGDKQSIFFVECDGGRRRECIIQIIGE